MYICCPVCGKRLIEGEVGSKVKVKCGNCQRVFNAKILAEGVEIKPNDKKFEERFESNLKL